ncbi:COMM domain-containing protein 10 [Exaiptasia diaphana]|uniref:COMM domain-containing protein n=1 Tax=Exaiptasia diaphana TaxID=2652724 RepID=A0A913XH14_EXADI|nr:COMM domain-containing protein 10 [Exaiptasia diaphana]KXJ11894.1 COMM domain-containing protein 10 [Exaiptasia diaphana]
MAAMFQVTPRLKKAVILINDVDSARFPLLLNRIIQKLHLRDEKAFSAEEEEKLQAGLSLSVDDLHIVLETCSFIFEQAAYHSAKPGILQQQLKNIELDDDKINSVIEIWAGHSKAVIGKLRQRSLAPKQLDGINWRLNLQMAQANKAKMKVPNALFEFQLSSSGEKSEKLQMEFTHEELYAFYSQLETIQSQLDALG